MSYKTQRFALRIGLLGIADLHTHDNRCPVSSCFVIAVTLSNVNPVQRMSRGKGDVREELCTQRCLVGGLVKGRMKWVGHVERMDEHRLPYMCTRGRGGRPHFMWVDRIKREPRKQPKIDGGGRSFTRQ